MRVFFSTLSESDSERGPYLFCVMVFAVQEFMNEKSEKKIERSALWLCYVMLLFYVKTLRMNQHV